MSDVITRFAPSPTGHLHVGGARTALFCWALARHLGGHFLLRIEDTDQARSSKEAAQGILEDLAWLGIHWDEGPELNSEEGQRLGGDPRGVGPFFQTERRGRYNAVLQQLVERDLAYPAFETPAELDSQRHEARAAKRNFRYRRAVDFDRPAALARMAAEPHVLRFRMPEGPVCVSDEILGEVVYGEDDHDDFVLRKRDGFPTYHLAVVVDDEAMGVTHVLRGQEHLNNTPKHVALQHALGYRIPIYAHLPVIFNPDGSKMSKRDKDKSARKALRGARDRDRALLEARIGDALPPERLEAWLGDKRSQLETGELSALSDALGLDLPGIDVEDFRRAGYLPEVVCNFLALLGWSPGEKDAEGRNRERFERAYLAEHFSTERIGKANAKFDRAKLLAFSQDSLAALSAEEFYDAWRGWCARYRPQVLAQLGDDATARRFSAVMQPRSRTLADPSAASGPGRFALLGDQAFDYDEKAVSKWLRKGEPSGLALLAGARVVLSRVDPFEASPIEAAVAAFCEDQGVGLGRVAQPIRVAISGAAATPPLGDTLAILGRGATLRRIDRCLETFGNA